MCLDILDYILYIHLFVHSDKHNDTVFKLLNLFRTKLMYHTTISVTLCMFTFRGSYLSRMQSIDFFNNVENSLVDQLELSSNLPEQTDI